MWSRLKTVYSDACQQKRMEERFINISFVCIFFVAPLSSFCEMQILLYMYADV